MLARLFYQEVKKLLGKISRPLNISLPEMLEKHCVPTFKRGDSSISQMPGCGPNALPKNWI